MTNTWTRIPSSMVGDTAGKLRWFCIGAEAGDTGAASRARGFLALGPLFLRALPLGLSASAWASIADSGGTRVVSPPMGRAFWGVEGRGVPVEARRGDGDGLRFSALLSCIERREEEDGSLRWFWLLFLDRRERSTRYDRRRKSAQKTCCTQFRDCRNMCRNVSGAPARVGRRDRRLNRRLNTV